MKVIICGGRDFNDFMGAVAALDKLHEERPITTVVQGGANGADYHGKVWAAHNGIPMVEHKAKWKELGRRAGPVRNQFMLDHEKPDAVIALPGGIGTEHMKRISKEAGVEVIELCN